MSEEEPAPAKIVRLDQAKSGRSTCRATGDKIEKDEFRVGVEVYTGGHISMAWQKTLPFLQGCYVDYSKTNTGADKKTGIKFSKGDARFVITCKSSKILLGFKSAAEEIAPVLENAGEGFKALSFKGLEDLQQSDRDDFFSHFEVSKADQDSFNKEHPAPLAPASPEPAKKKQKKAKKQKEEDEEQEEAEAEATLEEVDEEDAEHAETSREEPKIDNKPVERATKKSRRAPAKKPKTQ